MTVKTLDNLTLDELIETYICNKYGKDPIKCIDCNKHENCPAGKRAIELLNEMTEYKELTRQEKGGLVFKLRARQKAAELAKMEDPIKYLVEVDGLTVDSARNKIRRYKIKYPDLFGEKLTVMPHTAKGLKEARKADYDAAMASGKPIEYYMKKYGLKRDAAWQRWKYNQKRFQSAETKNDDKEEEIMNKDSEEEISLEDFLNQHEMEKSTETEDKIEKAVTNANETAKSGKAYTKIEAKYGELIGERDNLMAKLNWCNAAIQSFEMVMDILHDENKEGK